MTQQLKDALREFVNQVQQGRPVGSSSADYSANVAYDRACDNLVRAIEAEPETPNP